MTTILCVVFRIWLKMDLHWYAPFVFIGMTFWGFFSAITLQGCGCFFQGESYIRQFPAPMAIYPLRTVLGAGLSFLHRPGAGPCVGPVCAADRFGVRRNPAVRLAELLPSLALLLLFGWSVAILFGLLNVRFRDTRHLAEVGLQGFFT